MLIDYIFMIKENNQHVFSSRFGFSDIFPEGGESVCFHTLIRDLVRGSK